MDIKWVILLIACARAFFTTGSVKVSGVFLDEITHQLNTTKSFVAWALSLQNGVSLITAPFCLALLGLLGYRTAFTLGAFVAGGGYVLCGLFTDSVWQLFLWFCLSGLGFGFCILPSFLALEVYHKQDFPLMICIVHLFHFVGVAILPPGFQYLRNHYDLKDTLILYGAIVWNLAALGFGFPSSKCESSTTYDETKLNQGDKNQTKSFIDQTVCSTSQSENTDEREVFNFRRWLSPYLSCFVHKAVIVVVVAELAQKGIIFTSWALVVVSFGKSVGLTAETATLLSTVGGIGGFLGKIVAVALCKYDLMNTTTFYVIPCVINGITFLTCLFVTNFFTIYFLMFLIGLGIAINLSGLTGTLSSVVCRSHFRVAAVLLHISSGIGVQFGGLCAGFTYDVTGSAKYVLGLNGVLSLLMLLPIYFVGITDKPVKECRLENAQ